MKISNIHIRYEDDFTNSQTPFSFGITLEELSLRPCAETGEDNTNPDLSLVNKVRLVLIITSCWMQIRMRIGHNHCV